MKQIKKIKKPNLPVNLPLIEFQEISGQEEPMLGNGLVTGTCLDDEHVDHLVLSKVIFKNVSLINVQLYKIAMTDVRVP